MATLWLFCDEAGVMPKSDADELFVTGTIGFLGQPPSGLEFSGHREAVIAALADARALPALAFVKPSPGYAQALKAKLGSPQNSDYKAR